MLNDNRRYPCHIHLYRKTSSALQSVSLVGDAVILPQYARSAHCPAYYGNIMIALLPRSQGKIVRPALRCYRVAVTHESMILFLRQYVNSIEEIKPVGVAREVKGQIVSLGKISIGIPSLRQRTSDKRARIHLGIISKVNAHLYRITGSNSAFRLLRCHLLARSNYLRFHRYFLTFGGSNHYF